jgi:hypothetical protein
LWLSWKWRTELILMVPNVYVVRLRRLFFLPLSISLFSCWDLYKADKIKRCFVIFLYQVWSLCLLIAFCFVLNFFFLILFLNIWFHYIFISNLILIFLIVICFILHRFLIDFFFQFHPSLFSWLTISLWDISQVFPLWGNPELITWVTSLKD